MAVDGVPKVRRACCSETSRYSGNDLKDIDIGNCNHRVGSHHLA